MRHDVWFGLSLDGVATDPKALLDRARRADDDGLDLVSIADHPWLGEQPDAYATMGVVLGATTRISAVVDVTNLPTRPAPMLARAATTLNTLSSGRFVLGIGAGGSYPEIARLGAGVVSPGAAVRALTEAIEVVRALSGGGPAVTVDGEFVRTSELAPSPHPGPPIWTGSVGPASLAVTGRLADGWIPGHAADWRSERVATSRPVIDAAAVAAGRIPGDIATIYNVARPVTADELVTAVRTYGAGGFLFFGDDEASISWSRDVVPMARAGLARG
jgi:alkanesulfonate monooxygenase SsuD/methylene tetrahydromethanopterin reductase-like flavin-dependent oxidoreductase (luciferase family)